MKTKTYAGTVYGDEEDGLYIILPEELLSHMKLKENDTVMWSVDENKNIMVTKCYDYNKEV